MRSPDQQPNLDPWTRHNLAEQHPELFQAVLTAAGIEMVVGPGNPEMEPTGTALSEPLDPFAGLEDLTTNPPHGMITLTTDEA